MTFTQVGSRAPLPPPPLPPSPVKGFATQLYSLDCFCWHCHNLMTFTLSSHFLICVMVLTFSLKVLKCSGLSDPLETPLLQLPGRDLGTNHRIPANEISPQPANLGPWQEMLSGFCILTARGLPFSPGTTESQSLSFQHTPRAPRQNPQSGKMVLPWMSQRWVRGPLTWVLSSSVVIWWRGNPNSHFSF